MTQPPHDPSAPTPVVDLILHGGRVTTLDEASPEVSALAVRGEHIVATGADSDVLPLRQDHTRVVDLGGARVVPGLNDNHMHAIRGGLEYALNLRWDGLTSLRRGLEMIAEQASRTPTDQWVRVMGGWSPYQFAERRFPNVAELNDAGQGAKVAVLFAYSRLFLNAAGLEAVGVTETDEPLADGTYEFVEGGLIASGSPTVYALLAKLPTLAAEHRTTSMRHFFRELNRLGITSVVDAGATGITYPDDYGVIADLAREPGFPLRVSNFIFPQAPRTELDSFQSWTSEQHPGRDLAIGRVSGYVLDGGGEILVWDATDYEDFLKPRPEWQDGTADELAAVVGVLVSKGWPLRIHATYDETIQQILDVFERELGTAYTGRWVIDHGETITPATIQRIARLGGGLAVQDRLVFSGEFFAERYGPDASSTAQPLRAAIEAGLPLSGGTDATRVASYNPWPALSWFTTRRTLGGLQFGGPEHRLTREEALRIYTNGSAWISGEETTKGTLAVGRVADLAVLSADYLEVDDDAVLDLESVLTVVGGDVVHASGPFADLAPAPLPDLTPDWSPGRYYGGYQR